MSLMAPNECFIVTASEDKYEQLKMVVNASTVIHCTRLTSIINHLRTRPVTNIIIFPDSPHEVDKNEIWKIKNQFASIPLIVIVTFTDLEFVRFCGQIGIEKILSQHDIHRIPGILKKVSNSFQPDDFIKERFPDPKACSAVIADAFEILKNAYLTMTTIDELCHILDISNSLLCKTFKKYNFPTPKKVLDSLKMHHAAALMNNKGLLISEIAQIVGVGDLKLFIVCFKRIFGVTPGEYRKKGRKRDELSGEKG